MKNFAFDKTNYILIAVGVSVVILGFLLMSGDGTTQNGFNAEIFSVRRIRVAPMVCFIGFASMIYGIMHKPKDSEETKEEEARE